MIPFHRVVHDKREVEAVARILRSGRTGGGGAISRRVEDRIRRWTRGARVLLTPSGSTALEMAFLLLRLHPGDEVILPSFAFVSDANAILRAGGKPVFAEVEEKSLNISPEDIRGRVGRRTRAVLAVHYAGTPCRMDKILSLGRASRIAVVEDAAHAYGGTWRGKPLGGIGDLGIFSFHETKDLSCGEGGALTIRDDALSRRAEILHEKGTDRARFLRGEVPRYVWKDVGSSYLLSDILAAILEVQLVKARTLRAARARWWEMYREAFSPLEERGVIDLPPPIGPGRASCHIFFIRVRSGGDRDRVLRTLNRQGIEATFHFVPLHSSPFGRRVLGCKASELPVTERVARTLVRLPLHAHLRVSEVRRVIAAVLKAVG